MFDFHVSTEFSVLLHSLLNASTMPTWRSQKKSFCASSYCCWLFLGYSAMEFVILSLISTVGLHPRPCRSTAAVVHVILVSHCDKHSTRTSPRLAVSGSRRVPGETRRKSTTSRLFLARRAAHPIASMWLVAAGRSVSRRHRHRRRRLALRQWPTLDTADRRGWDLAARLVLAGPTAPW